MSVPLHCKINNLHMRNVLVLEGKIKPVARLWRSIHLVASK